MRTIVYVDGFNLYYVLRRLGCKWLDLVQLARQALPTATIERVKYYTARVSGLTDAGQPKRQQIYFNALGTTPEVEIHFGSFLAKDAWRPAVNIPIASRLLTLGATQTTLEAGTYQVDPDPELARSVRQSMVVGRHEARHGRPAPLPDALLVQVCAMEEKGSDVNLAVHLVNDAWAGRFEAAAVLSNDTDLVEPIRIVTQERRLPVTLLSASRRGAARPLAAVATSVRHIHPSHLRACQFPDPIVVADQDPIHRPKEWAAGNEAALRNERETGPTAA